jgi:hypothetical protein
MSHAIFDGLTRRAVFMTLGAVGLAGLRGSSSAEPVMARSPVFSTCESTIPMAAPVPVQGELDE